MNYGYDKSSPGWKEEKKDELFEKLAELIKDLNPENSQRIPKIPYIQMDGPHGSVTIRKITHLNPEERGKLVDNADAIYYKMMGIEKK